MKNDKHWDRKVAVLAAIISLFGASNRAQGGQTVGTTQLTFSGSCGRNCEVPFTLQNGYLIIVEARIGGQRRLKFALDTGATHSVLRAGVAKGEKLRQPPVRVVNLDHVMTEELLEVKDFQLGPIRIPRLPMITNDLSYLHETAPSIDGILGLDVLRTSSFGIDYCKRKIRFGTPHLLQSSAPIEAAESYLAVEVRMVDRQVRLLVDTGVPSILLYRDRMGDRLPNLKIEQRIPGASLAGSTSLDVVTLPQLRLSGTGLLRQAVLLRNSPAGFLPEVDGYLSLAAIGAKHVTFDLEHNLLSWD